VAGMVYNTYPSPIIILVGFHQKLPSVDLHHFLSSATPTVGKELGEVSMRDEVPNTNEPISFPIYITHAGNPHHFHSWRVSITAKIGGFPSIKTGIEILFWK
jgi:hypothetical protein